MRCAFRVSRAPRRTGAAKGIKMMATIVVTFIAGFCTGAAGFAAFVLYDGRRRARINASAAKQREKSDDFLRQQWEAAEAAMRG